MNETLLTVVGNVVDAPSRRALESGVSVTTFRVASTNRRFDKGEQRWTDGDPLYLRVTCWRQLADNTARSLSKGDPVMVTGRLFTRLYEVDGQRRASYELEASAVGTTTHRLTTSKPHWAHGRGELSLGRSADPWRVAEARNRRLRTHGVQVSAGPTDETVVDLAYIPREPHRQPGVRLDSNRVVRDER